uniref:Sulfotransferase n=1 Tax=Castor canadensis TaxID=51338 RepID=A0A8C0W4D5_CASCN
MYDDYLWIEGIPFLCVWFKPEIIREVLSYPKSGTNWLVQILCLICTKGDPKWVQSVSVWGTHHGVESGVGFELLKNMEGRRFTATHLPFQLFPKSFLSSKAKVIYLIRNPRNVAVSGYFFWKKLNVCKIAKSWDEYFEWFIQGKGECTWFEHTRGWMSMRERENFLVLSYEELKKDTKGSIQKTCQFLGKKLEPEEPDLVLKYGSFASMKENNKSNFSILKKDSNDPAILMRKGGKSEVFNKLFQEKMAGFPPGMFPWEECSQTSRSYVNTDI